MRLPSALFAVVIFMVVDNSDVKAQQTEEIEQNTEIMSYRNSENKTFSSENKGKPHVII